MLVSYTSFFQSLIFCFALIGILIMRIWPRNQDGSLMDPDELKKRVPSSGAGISPGMLGFLLLLLILTLAVVLH